MGPPSFHLEQYDANPELDDDESMEQTTLESSSMVADEDVLFQRGGSTRKRKRTNDAAAMSIREQEHILYGDQLLDYFMTVGDAPDARTVPPPEPPANFQVDRAIDDSGNTALHWACAMGDMDIVKDLLQRGADMRALSIHEETPLVRAVLFTNNYEKRTFPELLELLIDTVSFRDWFGATIFHHIAATTRSKGKWKSSRYYCEVLLDKLSKTYTQEEIDLLLSIQDSNGDPAALVAARNGVFRLASVLLLHCGRAGDLVNKKGETANAICERARQSERDIAPPSSSVIMGDGQLDDGEVSRIPNNDAESGSGLFSVTSVLTNKVESIIAEANKKLALTYGYSKAEQPETDDIENPEAFYEQLELDRQKIQRQSAALEAKEAADEAVDMQLGRYEQLRRNYASLLEQIQHAHLAGRVALAEEFPSSLSKANDLVSTYHLARQLHSAQKRRCSAVEDLIQQTADAGVSTKFDVHRKLVSLATGLKEEELDPMSAELADTLEFERMNGKGSAGPESPEPDGRKQSTPSLPMSSRPGPTVPVDT